MPKQDPENYHRKKDDAIRADFTALCGEVRAQLGERMVELTEKYVLPEADLLEAASIDEPTYDDSEIVRYLGEVGCPICRKNDELFLGEMSEPITGAGCRIKEQSCERMGGKTIGSFHTHPLGGNTPSLPDLECAISKKEEIMCIGGKIGDAPVVSCYTPKQPYRMRGMSLIEAQHYNPDVSDIPVAGELEFYRQSPPPNAEDVQEKIGDSDDVIRGILSAYNRIETDDEDMPELVAEFKDKLRNGEVPEEYWEWAGDMTDSDGTLDSIAVYAADDMRKVNELRKDRVGTFAERCEVKP